jgi:hypothetical protein
VTKEIGVLEVTGVLFLPYNSPVPAGAVLTLIVNSVFRVLKLVDQSGLITTVGS